MEGYEPHEALVEKTVDELNRELEERRHEAPDPHPYLRGFPLNDLALEMLENANGKLGGSGVAHTARTLKPLNLDAMYVNMENPDVLTTVFDPIEEKFRASTYDKEMERLEKKYVAYTKETSEDLASTLNQDWEERWKERREEYPYPSDPNDLVSELLEDAGRILGSVMERPNIKSVQNKEKGIDVQYVDAMHTGIQYLDDRYTGANAHRAQTVFYDRSEKRFFAATLDDVMNADRQMSATQDASVLKPEQQDKTRLQDISLPEPDLSKQGELTPQKSILDEMDWPKPRSKSEELRQDFTKKIIGLMEQGEAPWQRPWKLPPSCMPVNAVTGKRYNGNNIAYLMVAGMDEGYADPRWVTYKQAQERGWQVRKGEHGTKIEYWNEYDPTKTKKGEEQLNERIQGMIDAGASPGKIEKAQEGRQTGYIKHYTVFNATQIDGIPPLEVEPVIQDFQPNERAENIMDNCGVPIVYGAMRAAYIPSQDRIKMPDRELFNDENHFYSTALHEIAHSTGHSSRLNREEGMKSTFGTQEYAKEEIRAEMASLFINAGIGLVVTEEGMKEHTEQHAAYVQHWLKTLKDDYKEFFRATRDANKIADHVLAYEKERTLTEERGTVCGHDAAEVKETVQAPLDKDPGSSLEPEVGQRVTFQAHDGEAKLTGMAKEVNENEVVLQCGRATIPVLREKGTFTKASELDRTETADYARERAQRHIGEGGAVFVAGGRDVAYRGAVVEITPSYAIQKVRENAVLHRLKDLEPHKDSIREGTEVCIAKSSNGELTVEPRVEQEEKEHNRQKIGQSR